jgi:hypothetical protein
MSFINKYIPIPKQISDSSDLCYIIEGLCISMICYLFYIELAPGMGGIMFRPWSDGKIHFNPLGALPILKYPFQSKEFWKPEFWDINFITFTTLGAILYYTYKKYVDLLLEIQNI